MYKTSLLFRALAVFALWSYLTSTAAQPKLQVIAGAGPSTKVVKLFAEKFSSSLDGSNYKFIVPSESIKHKGGIDTSSRYIFGRTGRPLNEQERGMNKDEIILARVPISFVTGKQSGVSSLTKGEVKDIFSGKIKNWREVGGADRPIIVIGREPTEAIFSVLKQKFPVCEKAKFDRVYRRDHQVVRYLSTPNGGGAISFGANPNFNELNVIKVNGFSEGVEVGLVYDLKNSNQELVKRAKRYVASKAWADEVKSIGLLPPERAPNSKL
ncbi:MAG: substrate-binding domain-containing protein [Gammaproteobacteria bacterium]|nr:substrate-binding domain-containing protein [Gammaproteobacteria bacterium]